RGRRARRRARRRPGHALGGREHRLLPYLLARQRHLRPDLGAAEGGRRGRRRTDGVRRVREIREWLRTRLYVLGRKFTPQETIERVTGSRIDAAPYVRYLRDKLAPQHA